MADTPTILAAKDEEDKISRSVLVWLNQCPDVPTNISIISFELLPSGTQAMAVSVIQGAAITHKYINGGHEAEYQFKLVYRLQPSTDDQRLKASETLDRIGSWAIENPPTLGDGINTRKVEVTSRAALYARYEDKDEDYQVLMKITYEVI